MNYPPTLELNCLMLWQKLIYPVTVEAENNLGLFSILHEMRAKCPKSFLVKALTYRFQNIFLCQRTEV